MRVDIVTLAQPRICEQKFREVRQRIYCRDADSRLVGNVDPSRLALAGDSACGNMVAGVTLPAKQRGGSKLDLQVMFYPNTDASFSSDSYKQFASGYFLSRNDMEWFLDQYLPDKARRKEPTASPIA